MKRVVKIVFLSLFCWNGALLAQVCDGNLGDNIFTDGDFGTGADNLFPQNPNIAPGYTYTFNVPPVDGFYVLTNNTSLWPGLYPSWLQIPDNSGDPEGYMMVVNASFEPGLFYQQEVDGLCENTLYDFSADIINLIRPGVAAHIRPNVSFLIDNVSQYTTGDIAESGAWNTYGFTFTTLPGQTSVILSLRNNAPGGIGNDLALDNISFQPCGPLAQILPEDIERICEDGAPTELIATVTGAQYDVLAYQWQQSFDGGATWVDIPGENGPTFLHTDLSSGFYYYRYLLANGSANLTNAKCRVVSNVKIIEVVPKFWNVIDTICDGLIYISGNNEYTETGIYVDSLISVIGCDSVVTLDLTVVPDPGISADVLATNPICFGEMEGSIVIENILNGTPPFTFSINGSESITDTIFPNLLAGTYNVLIADIYGCNFQTEIVIENPQEFIIDLGPDISVQLGTIVEIDVTTNDDIIMTTWIPDVSDCDEDCLDFEILPENSAYYFLNAVSDDGCLAIDSVFIEVEKVRKVYIPNIFSPNFDGTNDYFAPIAISPNVQTIKSFRIFSRWGGLLYEGSDFIADPFSGGWDGTFKGKPVDIGVYVYLAEILFLDGEVIKYSGDVLLVR